MSADLSWHWLLELKLRRTTGNAFQTFFGDLMEARYGDDFVRVKPYGSLGDKGCDGYRTSDGAVYACYGAQNGAAGSVSQLVAKMEDDFAKARGQLGTLMRSWNMTHNIIEGLPTEALQKKADFEGAHPTLTFGFVGPSTFRQIMSELDQPTRDGFLGPAAQNKDYQLLQIEEVRDTVEAIISAVAAPETGTGVITPVSPEKLAFNELSGASQHILRSGRINAPHIDAYFSSHPDPMRGEAVAKVFRNRYAELKAQALRPDAILTELYVFVAGPGDVAVPRQVAAHSLLSFLFDSCDIFENAPVERTVT